MKLILNIVLPIALIGVLAFSGWKWYSNAQAEKESDEVYRQLESMVVRVSERATSSTPSVPAGENGAETGAEEIEAPVEKLYPPLEIDMVTLIAKNSDFRGWLYFPLLEVSYPMVQAEDNDYYLRRSYEGESLTAGTLFLDYGSAPDWSDRNTFVFGHNMSNGSMFGTFKNMVADPQMCAENPYFYIYTPTEVYTYEIFSFYVVKQNSDRYMTFTQDLTYDYYVQAATEDSLYIPPEEIDFSNRDNIVTLSTCSGVHGSGKRLLVHGVRIRTESYDESNYGK